MPDVASQVEFAVLGPLEACVSGRPTSLGGTRQRAVLAALLLHANEVVSSERLIEEVWGEDPPATAHKMVHIFVSRLRTSLENDAGRHRTLVTRSSGYLLSVSTDQFDLARFQALVDGARAILDQDPAGAADSLRSALSLWRGSPLSDLALEPFAQVAIPRLEELRLGALEDRIGADLAIGKAGDLVAELRDLVAASPLRERFQAQLMLALYRAGRQAEALEVFSRARTALVEELGIEPGPELQRLQGAVLRHETWLDPRSTRSMGGSSTPNLGDQQDATGSVPIPQSAVKGWRDRRRFGLATGALAVVALSIALAAANLKPAAPNVSVNPIPNSVAVVDPVTETLAEDIPVGAAPGPIAVEDGSAWIGNVEDHTLERIDLQTAVTRKTFGLSIAPTSLAASAGIIWIGNGFAGTLSRVLTQYDQLSAPFFPGPSLTGVLSVTATPSDLWVGLPDQTLLRLDPSNLRTRASLPLPGRARGIVVTGDAIWFDEFGDNTVTRFDLVSDESTSSVKSAGTAVAIVSGYGAIWVATTDQNQLLRIDAESGNVITSLMLDFSPTAMVADGGAVWVAGGPNGTLARVDPNGQTLVTTMTIGRPIGGIAVANGRIWLTLD